MSLNKRFIIIVDKKSNNYTKFMKIFDYGFYVEKKPVQLKNNSKSSFKPYTVSSFYHTIDFLSFVSFSLEQGFPNGGEFSNFGDKNKIYGDEFILDFWSCR